MLFIPALVGAQPTGESRGRLVNNDLETAVDTCGRKELVP